MIQPALHSGRSQVMPRASMERWGLLPEALSSSLTTEGPNSQESEHERCSPGDKRRSQLVLDIISTPASFWVAEAETLQVVGEEQVGERAVCVPSTAESQHHSLTADSWDFTALRERESEQSQFTWLITIIVAKIHSHVALFIDYFILSPIYPGFRVLKKGTKGICELRGSLTQNVPTPIALPMLGKILKFLLSE